MPLSKLSKLSNTKLFFLCFFFIVLFDIPFIYIVGFFDEDALLGMQFDNTPVGVFTEFLATVILAPFLETIIFQVIVIELLIRLHVRPLIAILTSALLFALSHNYHIFYILAVLPSGILFAYYYYILRKRKGVLFAFLVIALLHALLNLLAFLGNHVL